MKNKICLVFGTLLLSQLLFVDFTNAGNILVVAFFTAKSHMITYMGLIEELGNRGHNITVVSPFKDFPEKKNIKKIYTVDLDAIFEEVNFKNNAIESKEKEEYFDISSMIKAATEVCRKSYDVPQVKELLKEKFDLVIYEPFFNECVLGLIHQLQAPFVMFTSVAVPSTFINKIGGYLPPIFSQNIFIQTEITFLQRFIHFGVENLMHLFMGYSVDPMMETIYREKLGNYIPSVQEILRNCSLILSNAHFSLSGPRPYLPDVVDVGGIHSKKAKPVPKDLEDFIQKGKDGFILFSMGTATKSESMPEVKRKMILNVFSQLKQQIIYKWDLETMSYDLPKNVKLVKWLPQQDLLGHKDIKLFITHCGAGSIEESVYHGVPLVGLPMVLDQPGNAKLAEKHGFIVTLDWNKLDEDAFLAAINEVLNNSSYRQNVKHLSTLFKDRPMNSLELGVYWIEYIIRHKGAPHLRSVGRKLNFFQYHSYDVIGAYLLVLLIISYFLFSTIRFICRKLFCNRTKMTSILTNKKLN